MVSLNIYRGIEFNLPKTIKDGKIYFCTDTGNIYIDYESSRIHVNANKAKMLSYYDEEVGEYVDISAQDIFEIIENASSAYVQPEEPTDAPEGALWVDTDANGVEITVNGIAPDENGDIKINIPALTPNPYALKFVGAVSGSYNGSAPLTIHIPEDKEITVNGVAPDENGNIEIEVGEDITVNGIAPDENGNIEIPAAQSDWNQNDVSNPGYVHNRTHWVDGETIHQLDEKFIPAEIARVTDIPAAIISTEATIGQTIRIKNVSEGKPIEWEAVDFPETDLSNYYTKNEIDGFLNDYINAVDAIIG